MAAQWHVGRGGQTSGPYSSFPRVGAYILDVIFLTVFGLILAVPLGFTLFAALGQETGTAVAQPVGNLLGLLIGVCYYVGLET
ncbi:MAG: hypothetical protein RLZZ326_1890, partial [Planctomycetota bacterium]